MIPSKFRLSRNEVVEVKRKGLMGQGGGVSFLYRRAEGGVTRFGLVVSSRVTKLAVERSRIKRKLRGIVVRLLSEVRGGYQVLILARKSVLGVGPEELLRGLREGLRRKGIIGE